MKLENKEKKVVLVTEIHRGEIISILDGKKLRIKIGGSFLKSSKTERNFVTVGDKIVITFDKRAKRYILLDKLERKNQISRQDPFLAHMSHIIAANIDYLGVVLSLKEPDISWELADRYFISADKYNIPILLILSKVDLLTEDEIAALPLDIYRNLGIEIILTSSEKDIGIQEVKDKVRDKVTLFSGPSGAGKSTLLNLLNPEKQQKTSNVSSKDKRGRHTTRATRLVPLRDGGFIIDSPGIQDFTLDKIEFLDIKKHYTDFYPYAESCKYKNCTHTHEKVCGVLDALKENKISQLRYKIYLTILEDYGFIE